MNRALLIAAIVLTFSACDRGASGDSKADPKASADSKAAGDAKGDKAGDTKAASDKPAPACDKVVDNIASFNPGSGDAEKKLWNKMCADMSDAEKTCVAAAKDMAGMKSCMQDKKLE